MADKNIIGKLFLIRIFSEEVTFRCVGAETGRNTPGRGSNRYRDPEAGMTLAFKEIAEGQ